MGGKYSLGSRSGNSVEDGGMWTIKLMIEGLSIYFAL